MADSGLLPVREVKKVKAITGIRVASPSDEGAPYAIWIWGIFPQPLGKVTGFLLTVWDSDPPTFTEGSWTRSDGNRQTITIFPEFREYIAAALMPHWEQIKRLASESGLNPETGHIKPVTIAMSELKDSLP